MTSFEIGLADFRTACEEGARSSSVREDGVEVGRCTNATPAHIAAYNGQMTVLEVLSRKGARLEETNKGGDTPLHDAAREGHLHVVFLLLSLKVSPQPKNRRGETPQDVLKRPSATTNCDMEIFRDISKTQIMEKWIESEREISNLTREMRTQQKDKKDIDEMLRKKDAEALKMKEEISSLKDSVAKKEEDLEALKRDLAGAGDGQALRSALASLPPCAKKDFLGKTPQRLLSRAPLRNWERGFAQISTARMLPLWRRAHL
ncbi:hypothetical protein C7M84_006655 [Penaeus vannamei]|uniref:Uncharacterized protein n=1 Tax=Penaeus vannamei TaxID=6689 RepID=A0A3R7QQQ3_PENVA|nr:hypothetical protein C7M84_006655 [Penaeus vannamei]